MRILKDLAICHFPLSVTIQVSQKEHRTAKGQNRID